MASLITKTYTGHGVAGNMADPKNWDGTGGINEHRVALIPIDATLNGTVTVHQMMMLGVEAVTVNGVLATNSIGACSSFMVCNGAVVTFAATSTLNDAGGLVVGIEEDGALVAVGNAQAHSTLNTSNAVMGVRADSTGTVTIDGGVWHNATNMFVGEFGNGTLNVLHNGQVNVGTDFFVANSQAATGTVSLSSGAHLNVAGVSRIGSEKAALTGVHGAMSVGADSSFSSAGRLIVSGGSAITLAGGTIMSAASDGMLVLAGGTVSGYGTVTMSGTSHIVGTVQATGGTLVLNGNLNGHGSLQIADGSTAVINAATIGIASIAFAGANASLQLSHGVTEHAVISGFAAGDSILMAGVDHLGWNASTDLLTLSSGGHVVDTLHFAGTYAAGAFSLTQIGASAMIMLGAAHH